MAERIVVSVLRIGLILNRKSSSTEGAELGSCRWTPHRTAVSWTVPSSSGDDPRSMGRSSDAPRAQPIFRGADVRLVAPKDARPGGGALFNVLVLGPSSPLSIPEGRAINL